MAASYLYNAQGERVKKTVNGINTLFHYDQVGQLIAETDDQGALIQEYIYLDGTRLATVTAALPQEVITFVHTDHLGSPIALTDSAGVIQWQGSYDPYGKVTVAIDNVAQKLRFPGQYLDAETGLHYNYFRDYDPEIGRYLQSDPIGLNGGINTFGYVGGNPIAYIDPYGLDGRGFISPLSRPGSPLVLQPVVQPGSPITRIGGSIRYFGSRGGPIGLGIGIGVGVGNEIYDSLFPVQSVLDTVDSNVIPFPSIKSDIKQCEDDDEGDDPCKEWLNEILEMVDAIDLGYVYVDALTIQTLKNSIKLFKTECPHLAARLDGVTL